MKSYKKTEGKSCKNYTSRGGVEVRSSLHSQGLLNTCQIVQWDPENAKRSSAPKTFGMGYVKMHGFHGNLII